MDKCNRCHNETMWLKLATSFGKNYVEIPACGNVSCGNYGLLVVPEHLLAKLESEAKNA